MRPLAEMDAEIAALEKQLEAVHVERVEAAAARREAMIKAFDDGASRPQICEMFAVHYQSLGWILHRAGRTEKQRQRALLSDGQRVHFDKLDRAGIPVAAAASIARALP